MTLLPALLVAVLAGLLGALLTLLSGHGWVAALIVYWLSGNLGMVAMLVPLVLCRRRSGCDKPAANLPRLSARPMVWAMCWIMLGLGLIFWQVFASADPPSAPGGEIGAMVGLAHETRPAGTHYQIAARLPEQIRFLADLVLGLPLWLMGLVVYFLGVARLLSAASTRMHAADHD